MSGMNGPMTPEERAFIAREDLAFDALLAASAAESADEIDIDVDQLPELSDEEAVRLERLGADFVEQAIDAALRRQLQLALEERDVEGVRVALAAVLRTYGSKVKGAMRAAVPRGFTVPEPDEVIPHALAELCRELRGSDPSRDTLRIQFLKIASRMTIDHVRRSLEAQIESASAAVGEERFCAGEADVTFGGALNRITPCWS